MYKKIYYWVFEHFTTKQLPIDSDIPLIHLTIFFNSLPYISGSIFIK